MRAHQHRCKSARLYGQTTRFVPRDHHKPGCGAIYPHPRSPWITTDSAPCIRPRSSGCRATGLGVAKSRPLRAARDDLFAIFDGKGGALSRSQPANLRTNSAQLGFLTTSSAAQWRLATRPGRRERGVCSRWLPSYANTACGTRCSECVSDPAGAWPWFWKPPTGRVAGVSGPCLRHGGSTQHRREHGRLTDVGGLACGEQSQVSVLR
jgi:hypothetical protein